MKFMQILFVEIGFEIISWMIISNTSLLVLWLVSKNVSFNYSYLILSIPAVVAMYSSYFEFEIAL